MTILLLSACIILLAAAVSFLALALVAERRRARGCAAAVRAREAAGVSPAPARTAAAPGTAPAPTAASAIASGFEREGDLRQLLGLLSHELRSPLGAIIGYQELLTDGLLGPLPDRALDAIRRIGTSGDQLRHLIDGLTDLLIPEHDVTLDLQQVDTAAVARTAAESARALAAGRSVRLEVVMGEALPQLVTEAGRLGAVLDLAVGAAVRASPGATLTLSFAGEAGALLVRVDGAALDSALDTPASPGAPGLDTLAHRHITSGAGLRLAMAARIAAILGGSLVLEARGPLRLRIPSAPIDAVSGRL